MEWRGHQMKVCSHELLVENGKAGNDEDWFVPLWILQGRLWGQFNDFVLINTMMHRQMSIAIDLNNSPRYIPYPTSQ